MPPNRPQSEWDDIFADFGAAVRAWTAYGRWIDAETPDNVTLLVDNARTKVATPTPKDQAYLDSLVTSIRTQGNNLTAQRNAIRSSVNSYITGALRDELPAVAASVGAILDELIEQMGEDSQTVKGNVVTGSSHEADIDNTGDAFLLSELDDFEGQLNDWDIDGFGPANTDDGSLYVDVTFVSPGFLVEVYKDSGKAPGDLVCSGSTPSPTGTVLLTEDNSSGMSGSVTLDVVTTPLAFELRVPTLTSMVRPSDKIDIICTSATSPGAEIWSVNSKLRGNLGNATTGVEFTSATAGITFTIRLDNVSPRYTISGDDFAQLSEPKLVGFAAANTDSGTLYVRISFSSPVFLIELFSNSDLAAANLVASGSLPTPIGTVVLAEANGSGLSGSIELSFVADDATITIVVPSAVVGDKFSLIMASDNGGLFFTFFRDAYNKELPNVLDASETIAESLAT